MKLYGNGSEVLKTEVKLCGNGRTSLPFPRNGSEVVKTEVKWKRK